MPETRGYSSIVDRDVTDQNSWGAEVDLDLIPEADAPFEIPRDADPQPEDRLSATKRWTRELEQRFTRQALLNPDIEDRLTDDLTTFDDLSKDTVITGGKEDAVDDKSYKVRTVNRPTHQGDIAHLEGDYFLHMTEQEAEVARAHYEYDESGRTLVGPDGEEVTYSVPANADNRDRLSGWGVTYTAENVPGAGAWQQGTEQTREDGVKYYPDTEFLDANLPNANTEHESDYIDPNDPPEGEEDEV